MRPVKAASSRRPTGSFARLTSTKARSRAHEQVLRADAARAGIRRVDGDLGAFRCSIPSGACGQSVEAEGAVCPAFVSASDRRERARAWLLQDRGDRAPLDAPARGRPHRPPVHGHAWASGAVVKGVRRTKSRFGGRLEPFFRVRLVLYEGRGELHTVTQAEARRVVPAAARARRRDLLRPAPHASPCCACSARGRATRPPTTCCATSSSCSTRGPRRRAGRTCSRSG